MGLYDPALTDAGLLSAGKLTQKARDLFFAEVGQLLMTGNAEGKGLKNPITALLALPPVDPIQPVKNFLTGKDEHVLWFDPDPFAAQTIEIIKVRDNAKVLHAVFLDTLFEKTAVALDLPGSTPFAPILDYSAAFGAGFPVSPKFPADFLPKLKDLGLNPATVTLPALMQKLGVKFPPPVPPSVGLPIPPVPTIPSTDLGVPPLVLPAFVAGAMQLPFDVLKGLLVPPSVDLALNIPALPAVVGKLAFDAVIELLSGLNLVPIGAQAPQFVPKLLIACTIVYVKNVIGMIVTDIIAKLIGTGQLSKSGAVLCGLV